MLNKMLQTFAARTATTSSVFFERLGFSDFGQLSLDLLSIWSGIKVVVYITLWFSSISATFCGDL